MVSHQDASRAAFAECPSRASPSRHTLESWVPQRGCHPHLISHSGVTRPQLHGAPLLCRHLRVLPGCACLAPCHLAAALAAAHGMGIPGCLSLSGAAMHRSGGDAVHLLPAGGRAAAAGAQRGDHLRPGAHHDCAAGAVPCSTELQDSLLPCSLCMYLNRTCIIPTC